MNRRQLAIVLTLTAIIIGLVTVIMSGGEPPSKKKKISSNLVKYVRVASVENDTIPYTLNGYGTLESFHNLNVSAEVSGKLLKGNIQLKPGAKFNRGDVLYRIDDTEARYGLLSRKSAFLNALAIAMADLKIDFKDAYSKWYSFYENVDVEKALPQLPEIQSTKEKTFLASKNVLGEYYAIKADETRLAKYTVIAPFSGSITQVFAEVGSTVNPGNNIANIIQEDKLEAVIPVAANNIHLVELNQHVELKNKSGEALGLAQVTRISGSINTNTQTVDVFAQLNEASKTSITFAGMFVNTTISSGLIENAYEIPRRALLNDESVYVLSDSSLVKKSVVIEKINPKSYVISGLPNGASVVVEPVSAFSANQKFAALR